jgi:hypothetical protein
MLRVRARFPGEPFNACSAGPSGLRPRVIGIQPSDALAPLKKIPRNIAEKKGEFGNRSTAETL